MMYNCQKFNKLSKITNHSCYRDAWKSTVYNVKTVSTDISGNIHRKCPIFFPDLYLPDWMTTKTIHHCPIT